LRILLGDDAADALTRVGGGQVVERATVSQVRYVPGKSVTVQYRTRLTEPSGKQSKPMLVATSGLSVPAITRIGDAAGMEIALWRFPLDPFLPGLATALDEEAAVDLLAKLGAPTERVELRTRAYRATRRAVIEARGDTRTIYIKALRPSRVEALQNRHKALAPHLPIPRSLGWSRRLGVVAMQALEGATLRGAIERGERELPSPQALLALLDRFPNPGPETPAIKGVYERAAEFAHLIGAVLPESAVLLGEIVPAVTEAALVEPVVAVHGDFHSSQVLVDSGGIVGVVDVDTAGAGQRSDDLANLIGQLSTLTLVSGAPPSIAAYIDQLLGVFDTVSEPEGLRLRVAAAVLGLATGPFRVQLEDWPEQTMRRLELAGRWIDAAASRENPHDA